MRQRRCKGAAGQAEGQAQMCHVPARERLQETQGGLLLPHLLPLPGGFQKAHLPQKGGLGGKTCNSPLLTGFHLDSVSPAVTLFLS